ncbi:MAG: hypothetical protein HY927_04140 [Elusimicrobia bacterium]|nr:hypothetical protein [Elusimicrobiota bacterium]
MAYYKKRRNTGPSKNDLKVRRNMEAERQTRGGVTLSQRFPNVERLTVKLEILGPQKQLFSKATRAFGPSDRCEFSVPCPGRCGGGSFDLEGKLTAVLTAGQTVTEATGICQQPIYPGASEVCGCQLRCGIEASYLPEPAAAPQAPAVPPTAPPA